MINTNNDSDNRQQYKYVLYARKSSVDEGAQAKSIEDQLKYCEEYADRNSLHIVEIIKESASARYSNNRPKFTEMIKKIKDGKYNAILCWHPDRLARNALEGGKIVDMLDSGIIKDLRFPTLQFSNDSNGKLLLGILFAMAKQYTDHLSENVQRGVDTNLEQGKSVGTPKWGYTRSDITGYYEPDNKSFDIVKTCWEMRLEGKTLIEIVDYLKLHPAIRTTKITDKNKKQRNIKLHTKQVLSKMFQDPFFYGVLIQSNEEIDLAQTNPNYKPMITKNEYDQVQALSNNRARIHACQSHKVFFPLRGMVYCSVCNGTKPMVPGRNKSSNGKYYLTYRCDNKGCTRDIKSVRAKCIFDELYKELRELKFTDKEYKKYDESFNKHINEQLTKLRTQKHSLEGARKHKSAQMEELTHKVIKIDNNAPKPVKTTLYTEIKSLESEINKLSFRIEKIDNQLNNSQKIELSAEEFLNFTNSVADKMRKAEPIEKDALARIMLLNIYLDNEKRPTFIWKEPFKSLIKAKKINSGGAM